MRSANKVRPETCFQSFMANTISTIGTGTATVELADLGLAERGNANLGSAQGRMEGVTINTFDLSRCSVMA